MVNVACDVCPWWAAYSFDNRLRHWLHDPRKLFGPYVRPGMTVLDLGSGMGFSAIAIASMVGDAGCVVAVDLQEKMLDVLRRRARKAGVAQRIRTHRCTSGSLDVNVAAELAVAFWMVHEVPDHAGFFRQVRQCLKPGGKFLIAEPRIHVTARAFDRMLETAQGAGFKVAETPSVRLSRAALLVC